MSSKFDFKFRRIALLKKTINNFLLSYKKKDFGSPVWNINNKSIKKVSA